jgi:uncharacterized protein Yka (UPF0111/DUF47 family)
MISYYIDTGMSKTRLKNINFLNGVRRVLSVTGETKNKTDKLIDLYSQGKVSQLRSIMNIILSLNSNDEKLKKKGLKDYNKKIQKFENNLPLAERLANQKIKRIQTKSVNKIIKSYKLNKIVTKIDSNEESGKDKAFIRETLHLNTRDAFPRMPNLKMVKY